MTCDHLVAVGRDLGGRVADLGEVEPVARHAHRAPPDRRARDGSDACRSSARRCRAPPREARRARRRGRARRRSAPHSRSTVSPNGFARSQISPKRSIAERAVARPDARQHGARAELGGHFERRAGSRPGRRRRARARARRRAAARRWTRAHASSARAARRWRPARSPARRAGACTSCAGSRSRSRRAPRRRSSPAARSPSPSGARARTRGCIALRPVALASVGGNGAGRDVMHLLARRVDVHDVPVARGRHRLVLHVDVDDERPLRLRSRARAQA